MKMQVKYHEVLETYLHPPLWVCKIICHEKIAKMDARVENYFGLRFIAKIIYLFNLFVSTLFIYIIS